MPGTQQSIKWSLDSAKIPSHLEHVGLYRSDGKRPDGVTLVSCKEGRVHVLVYGMQKKGKPWVYKPMWTPEQIVLNCADDSCLQ